MNRRQFLKFGFIALAGSLWGVAPSKDSVITKHKEKTQEKTQEFPVNCENCWLYFCGPDCPHWWDRPYFVANSIHEVLQKPEPWEENIEEYYHVTDLGMEADRHPSPEYAEWKEKTREKKRGLGDF